MAQCCAIQKLSNFSGIKWSQQWKEPADPPSSLCRSLVRWWRSRNKNYFLTLPSAPSSTPSIPRTISVETETPPEGCRCFCPSIFRSLNEDKKIHNWKTYHNLSFFYGKHQADPLPAANTTWSEFHYAERGQSLSPISKQVLNFKYSKMWRYSLTQKSYFISF